MTNHPQALKVVIADDETPARSRVRDLLEDCASSFPIELVGEAASGRELLALLDNSPADVVLLDIRMPEMDGLEAAQHLLKYPEPPSVIFTTAYNDYALKAFELHAIDYLVKPIRLRRLHDALTRARSITPLRLDVLRRIAPEPRKHLSVQERGKVMLVAVSDIRYLRAELKYVTVRTAAREYLVEESLSRLEQEFADQFVRIHRSCLVAKAHIVGFEKDSLDAGESRWTVMLNGLEEKLQVSRRQQHIVKEFGRSLL
ncbi:MAG TPA: LytTR family DNA-binding domain-containing protein [Burkholderiales bacterium]|nr:LytTR family DNA-binding domain-containing protein [Burkholderiales bacterium]